MACPDAKRFSPIYPQFAPLEELVFPTEFFTVASESTVFPKSGGSGASKLFSTPGGNDYSSDHRALCSAHKTGRNPFATG